MLSAAPHTAPAGSAGSAVRDLYAVTENEAGEIDVDLHLHAGQLRALQSRARFVLILAGTQGGKTSFGPIWLFNEMQARGAGDYIVATPTFPLLELKLLPEFRRFFEEVLQLGEYRGSPSRVFTVSPDGDVVLFGAVQPVRTRILFGHAQDPDSLESATAKAAWLDEAGQKKFKRGSWEAIQRRLSIHQGRVLITTTPYVLGWLKNEVHDPALRGDPDYALVQFESTMNPAFPRAEFERMRRRLPRWKFNMMYRGRFERPAGMIYDCFKDDHKVPRFPIPADWRRRYLGLDFGAVNTAAVYLAEEPTPDGSSGRFYLYRSYHEGSRTAEGHASALLGPAKAGPKYAPDRPTLPAEPGKPLATGGAKSEDQWRREFTKGGLPVEPPPIHEVEVGIDRVYGLIAEDRLRVFDDEADVIDQLESYSRELGPDDEPTEKIEDKETYHLADALRYIVARIEQPRPKARRRARTTAHTTG